MDWNRSSQDFIRALKAASDPPSPEGPSKLEIARQVWDDASFYVPSKAEVVAEWIIGKFTKEKAKEPLLNPILDIRFWSLLHDVVSPSDTTLESVNARPLKVWLSMLLNRIPIAPIFVSFLRSLSLKTFDSQIRRQLSQVACSCLGILWPFAVQKLHTETLLECFGAFMDTFRVCEPCEKLAHLGSLVTSSYRDSLLNSPNKKKIYVSFLQNYFHDWLQCSLKPDAPEPYRKLLEAIYICGAETLFNLDILRQSCDFKSESTLFENIRLASSSDILVLSALPKIFNSYLEALRRYRGTLFGQGSSQHSTVITAGLCTSGMQFFASCQVLLHSTDQNSQMWSIEIALLELVDKNKLFGFGQLDAELSLNQCTNKALTALESGGNGVCFATDAIECLSALTRIDYDLVIPKMARILPNILLAREPHQQYLTFLDLLLTYHTKTHNMNAYIDNLFLTFNQNKQLTSVGAPEIYQISLSGPLFESNYLKRFSKAVQTTLTGSQICHTTEFIFESLKGAWEHFDGMEDKKQAQDNESSRKKRKLMDSTASEFHRDTWAVIFSLSAHLATMVLASLPMNSVQEITRQELCYQLNNIRKFGRRVVSKAIKKISGNDGAGAWSPSIIAASTLRLLYALDTSGYLPLASEENKHLSKLSGVLRTDGLFPELHLEILRSLLGKAFQREKHENCAVLDDILWSIESHYESTASWSGHSHLLTCDKPSRRTSALALMHMIIERWLPVIESFASYQQLERFVIVAMSVDFTDSCQQMLASTSLQPQSLLIRTLSCAQFWELPIIRNVFLTYLDNTFSSLKNDLEINPSIMPPLIAKFRLLLLLPVEYLPRSNRADFTQRALVADRFITSSPDNPNYIYHLTLVRIFLGRIFARYASEQPLQNLCDILDYLITTDYPPMHCDNNLFSATTDLIGSLFLEVFKPSMKVGSETILKILRSLGQIDIQSGKLGIRIISFMRLVEVLEAELFVSFSQEFQSSMCELYRTLSMTTLHEISKIETNDALTENSLEQKNSVMTLWCSILSFGKWLALTDNQIPRFGKHLTSTTLQLQARTYELPAEPFLTAFAILLHEFHYCPENDRLPHLNFIAATYISFAPKLEPSNCQKMDHYLSKISKALTVLEFSHLLELLSESLSNMDSPEKLAPVVQLSGVVLRDHPKGTLKQMQVFSSQAISAFGSWYILIDGPIQLRVQTLRFLAHHCTERPAILQPIDIGGIWTLLSRFLAGSCVHDDGTTLTIFHEIIAIIGALVHFRRDLVLLTLPHLGHIMRQLMLATRRVRPHLGTKQTLLVTDTFPRWLNARNPIGVEEAKALNRLLESLATKSMTRNNTSPFTTQKAESLAKPFSKHAVIIIKAYTKAMNDPLCILPSELRRELQNGLYVVCGMISDHSRNAMMVTLNAGEKSAMKMLWKDYEKQRYIGKG